MFDFKRKLQKTINNHILLNPQKEPVISIITPYYNTGEVFLDTYYSVLNQTYPFFEWIIIDDGSTDPNSIKQLNDLSKKDNRIKLFRKKNEGPAIARDYALTKISKESKYIYFQDSDDFIEPTLLECLYWTLETHPEASFAYTDIVAFGEQEYLWSKYLTVDLEKKENVINGNSMIRKSALSEIGGGYCLKDRNVYEDWNLWLKMLAKGKIPIHVNAPLFWYRTSKSSESVRAKENHEHAMTYINQTASTIKEDVPIIQFPRLNTKWKGKDRIENLCLPCYKKNNKKTILMIVPWTVVGGADKFNLDLIRGINKEQYEIILLTTLPSENPLRCEFIKYCDLFYDLSTFLEPEEYLSFVEYLIKSRNVDILFVTNSVYGYAMIPQIKLDFPDIHIIDYIHAVDYSDRYGGFAGDSKHVQQCIDKTFTCNNFTRDQLKNDWGFENVETLYIGTDEKRFDPKRFDKNALKNKYKISNDKKIVSLVARISSEKRPMLFVEIAKKIIQERSDVLFLIAGDGPLYEDVKQKIIEEHLENDILLLGMCEYPEEIYAISDVTVLCSEREGLSLTSYESLAMGVPMVSSDVGGQKELINDEVGKIVSHIENPNTSDSEKEVISYVDAIQNILEHLKEYRTRCRKRILSKFTVDLMISNFETAISKLTSIKSKKVFLDKNLVQGFYMLYLAAYYDAHYLLINNYMHDHYGDMEEVIEIPEPENNYVSKREQIKIRAKAFGKKFGIEKELYCFLCGYRNIKSLLKILIKCFINAFCLVFSVVTIPCKVLFHGCKKILMRITN